MRTLWTSESSIPPTLQSESEQFAPMRNVGGGGLYEKKETFTSDRSDPNRSDFWPAVRQSRRSTRFSSREVGCGQGRGQVRGDTSESNSHKHGGGSDLCETTSDTGS